MKTTTKHMTDEQLLATAVKDAEMLGFISGLTGPACPEPASQDDPDVGYCPEWPQEVIDAWHRGRAQGIGATSDTSVNALFERRPDFAGEGAP